VEYLRDSLDSAQLLYYRGVKKNSMVDWQAILAIYNRKDVRLNINRKKQRSSGSELSPSP